MRKRNKRTDTDLLAIIGTLAWVVIIAVGSLFYFTLFPLREDPRPEATTEIVECAHGAGRITERCADPVEEISTTATSAETEPETEAEIIHAPETPEPEPIEPETWETETYVPDTEISETTPPQVSGTIYLGTFLITGYTAEAGFPVGQATHSGLPVGPGVCAMEYWQRISLGIEWGEQIYVEGIGVFTVLDSGCEWGVVDIWVPTNAEAFDMTAYHNVYLLR